MLSIIIPTLNEEKYLPKLLESIKKGKMIEAYIMIGEPFYVYNEENSKKSMSNLMKKIIELSNVKNG